VKSLQILQKYQQILNINSHLIDPIAVLIFKQNKSMETSSIFEESDSSFSLSRFMEENSLQNSAVYNEFEFHYINLHFFLDFVGLNWINSISDSYAIEKYRKVSKIDKCPDLLKSGRNIY